MGAIVAIVAAIAVIAYYRVSTTIVEKCVFPTSSGLYCDKVSMIGSDVSMKVNNSLTDEITVLISSQITFKGDTCNLFESKTIQPEGLETLVFSGAGCPSLLEKGRRIKADVYVQFTDSSGFSQGAKGTLITKVP